MKEINIAFTPYEFQVYYLDNPDILQLYFNPLRATGLSRWPPCAPPWGSTPPSDTGGILKGILNWLNFDAYKADDTSMGEGPDKAKSQLIILDRGFDITTALLHELTFQAMAFDFLEIQNDVYKYEAGEGNTKEVILDENDTCGCS